jgi:tetratricopeptide (TPR) repeat protein
MQVQDKKLLLLIIIFSLISFSLYNKNVYADSLDKVRIEYSEKNYDKALKLLEEEISKDPNNPEAYKLLGLIYESMFEISKSIEAYKKYEELKKKIRITSKITPLPKISSNIKPSPLKKIEKIKSSPIPSISPTLIPSISPIPRNNTLPIKPLQPIRATPIPKLVKNNNIDKKIAISTNSEGLEIFKVNNVEKKKL